MATIAPFGSPNDLNLTDSKITMNKPEANSKYATGNQAIEEQSGIEKNQYNCSMVKCVYKTICEPIICCRMVSCLCCYNIFLVHNL